MKKIISSYFILAQVQGIHQKEIDKGSKFLSSWDIA
jgi:hypothetical protein